jgi:hypothetical protein
MTLESIERDFREKVGAKIQLAGQELAAIVFLRLFCSRTVII